MSSETTQYNDYIAELLYKKLILGLRLILAYKGALTFRLTKEGTHIKSNLRLKDTKKEDRKKIFNSGWRNVEGLWGLTIPSTDEVSLIGKRK